MPAHPGPPPDAGSPARRVSTGIWRFEDCELNAATRELRRGPGLVAVRRQVFDLLLLLLQHSPQTVGSAQLRQAVWGRDNVASGSLARTVLEARRAIGDDRGVPRLLVSVHGVGYRFAGLLLGPGAAGLSAGQTALAGAVSDSPLAQAEAGLKAAEAAVCDQFDLPRSTLRAEQALAIALRHGLQVETGKLMCWLAWLAIWSGSLDTAAGHVGHALQIASLQGHEVLAARARTVDSFIQSMLGDISGAMDQLNQAYPVLVRDGHWLYRCRCENLLSSLAMHLGDLEAATHWCSQSLASADAGRWPLLRWRAMSNQASISLAQGDGHQRAGRQAEAQAIWQAALQAVDDLLAVLPADVDPWLRVGAIGNRGQLLGRLGRLDQERLAQDAVARQLDAHPQPGAPDVLDRRFSLAVSHIDLCLRENDPVRALQAADDGIHAMAAAAYDGPWKPPLYRTASEAAERCGRLDLALRWQRLHHEAHVALEGSRAAALTRVMQARSQHDAQQAQLASARAQVAHLERLNASLLQRLHPPAQVGQPLPPVGQD